MPGNGGRAINRDSWYWRTPSRFRWFGPAFVIGAAAWILACGGSACASSYSGAGDWTIPAATTEVVSGEIVNVTGNVTVLGNLTFEQSTLVIWGGQFPPLPVQPIEGLFIPGHMRVAASGTLVLNGSTLRAYSSVNITGRLFLNESVLDVTSHEGARMSVNITSGFFNTTATGSSLAVNSTLAVLGRAFVAGNLTLVSSSLRFGTDPYANASRTAPFGIVASGRVVLTDTDGSSDTTADASVLGATGNGTYSTFQGGLFMMNNSRGESLGEGGYPGLEFNGSYVFISGCTFIGPGGAARPAFDGLRAAIVANGRNYVQINDTSFDGVALPIVVRGGDWTYIYRINITGHVAGIQLINQSFDQVSDVFVGPSLLVPGRAAWPPFGTAVAYRNATNQTLRGLRVFGDPAAGQGQALGAVVADGVVNLTIEDVDVRDAGSFINVNGSGPLIIKRLYGERVGGGLLVSNFTWTQASDLVVKGDLPVAFSFLNCTGVDFGNATGEGWVGLDIRSTNVAFVRSVTLNVTQAAMRVYGSTGLTASNLTFNGLGNGLTLVATDRVAVAHARIEFSAVGLNAFMSDDLLFHNVTFVAPPVQAPDEFLRLNTVTRFSATQLSYSGACGAAGSVLLSAIVSIDRLDLPGCEQGLSFTRTNYVTLPWVNLRGTWNGTAFGLYSVADALIQEADFSDAWGAGVALIGSQRVSVLRFDASGAGADGVLVKDSKVVELQDGDASRATGRAVSFINCTLDNWITRVNASQSLAGLEVVDCPGLQVFHLDASGNSGDGVNFDAASTGAMLVNLTLNRNGGAGLRMDAVGTRLFDGNISSNLGDGLAPGASIRLDWQVIFAASFTNGRARFTGDLLVAAGASFVARDAVFHIDSGPRRMPLAPPPLFSFGPGSSAVFDGVTMDSVNDTAPYTLDFGTASAVEILGSSFTGSGRGQVASAIQGAPVWLAIRNSTLMAFSAPLDATGVALEISDTNFTDNDVGPRIGVQRFVFNNLTVERSMALGLDVAGVSFASGERLVVRLNAGIGARFAGVGQLTLDTAEAYENLQGGMLLDNCVAKLLRVSVASNTGFGLRLQGGGRATLDTFQADANSGSALLAQDLAEISVAHALMYNGLGRGIDLARVGMVRLDGIELYDHPSFGLVALDVGNLTVVGGRFVGSGVSHIVLQGLTLALFVDGSLERSPGDAIALNGTSRGTFVAVAGNSTVGRVSASENAYGYLLNSTLAAPFVLDNARVDVAWNLSVLARRETLAAVAGLRVDIDDALGSSLEPQVTGAGGMTPTFTLLAKNLYAGGNVIAHSPHWFNASLTGGGGGRLSVEVDRYMVVSLMLDSTPPVTNITLEGLAGLNGWFLGPVTGRITAVDGSGYGVTLFWRIAGGPWESGASGGNFTETAVAVDGEGVTTVEFYAVDGVGNTGAVERQNLSIDLEPPTASFLGPDGAQANQTFWVYWTADGGNGSGCCLFRAERSYSDEPYKPFISGAAVGGLVNAREEGTYRFRLIATDGSGRESRPAILSVDVFLNGTVRLSVTTPDGAPVNDAVVTVVDTTQIFAGAGPFDVRLPAGDYRISLSAPGFVPRTINVTVASHNLTDLGTVALERVPQATTSQADSGLLPLGLLFVAAAAAVGLVVWRRTRRPPEAGDGGERERRDD